MRIHPSYGLRMGILGLLLAAGTAGWPATHVELVRSQRFPGLTKQELRYAEEALKEGWIRSPDAAIHAARKFLGNPDAAINYLFFREGDDCGEGPRYVLGAPGEGADSGRDGAALEVSAIDGRVLAMKRRRSELGEAPPVLSEGEAFKIAESFFRAHHPEFASRRWTLDTPWGKRDEDGEYSFQWLAVEGRPAVLSMYGASVSVGKGSGRVESFWFPLERTRGPLVPAVIEAQARGLAAPHALADPAERPFGAALLQRHEDDYGVVGLKWMLPQSAPDPYDGNRVRDFWVEINALTGDLIYSPAEDDDPAPWRRALREEARRTARLLTAREIHPRALVQEPEEAPPVRCVSPRLEKGEIWMRDEYLRQWGARVHDPAGSPVIRFRSRRMSANQLGGEHRNDGWWVPLRRAVVALGWKMAWKGPGHPTEIWVPQVKN